MQPKMEQNQAVKKPAAHGPVPAFSQPLHVGKPNIGDRQAFLNRVNQILDDQWLTNNGPLVQELEHRVAELHGVRHCVAMCNGTIALEIAIRALGLSGEVIVPSYTFVATAHALSWQGITPIFADIDPATHNLDPVSVRRCITPHTTGIIGVHLWGRPAPIAELQQIAAEHELQLMFDAAHAFGCSLGGTRIGNFGRCEVLSFHATKVFNSFEGGAVLTNDDALVETMRLMRNFGFAGFDNVIHPGTNGKLTEVHAAMGLTNLEAFPVFVEANRLRHEIYSEQLASIEGVRLIQYSDQNSPNYQYVVIELEQGQVQRDRLVAGLHEHNVLARKYFWPGCHGMKLYREQFPNAGIHLPQTLHIAERVAVLPTGQSLAPEDVRKIAMLVKDILKATP